MCIRDSPTFFYESLWNFVGIFLIYWIGKHWKKFDGQVFWSYVLWYGLGRFWIEGLRTDSLLSLIHISLRLALGVSDRLDAAADTAQRLLEGREEPGGMLAPIAQRLGLDQVQALGAFALLRHLASVRPGAEGRPPQCELWQFGISGDLPIAAAPLEGGVGEDKIGLWCAQHRFLTRAGWPFDLVLSLIHILPGCGPCPMGTGGRCWSRRAGWRLSCARTRRDVMAPWRTPHAGDTGDRCARCV